MLESRININTTVELVEEIEGHPDAIIIQITEIYQGAMKMNQVHQKMMT